MKKLGSLLVICLLLAIAQPSTAQTPKFSNFSLNANANMAFPVGDYAKVFQLGYGLHFGVNYKLLPKWEVYADIGYYQWNFSRDYLRLQILPFVGANAPEIFAQASFQAFKLFPGVRFYIKEQGVRPYIEGSIALLWVRFPQTINVDFSPENENRNTILADPLYKRKFKTGLTGGIGVLIPVNNKSSLDLTLSLGTIFQELNQTFNYFNSTQEFTTTNNTIIYNLIISAGYKIKI